MLGNSIKLFVVSAVKSVVHEMLLICVSSVIVDTYDPFYDPLLKG